MTEKTAPTNVVEALARVMEELPGIAKVKHPSPSGKGLTYAYRGIEEITSEVQGLFAKYGIVVVPRVYKREVKDIIVNNNDWTDTYLEVGWRIYGPAGTDDVIEASTFGHGRDNSDKGTNKAMTQAFKYLLLDMLCISDPADDNDGTNVEGKRKTYDPSKPLYEEANGEQIPQTVLDGEVTREGPVSTLASAKQVGFLKHLLDDAGVAPSVWAKVVNEVAPPWPDALHNLSKAQMSAMIDAFKPVKRGGYLQRKRALNARSVKAVERDAELKEIAPLVFARAEYRCEAQLEGCTVGVTSELHHRKRRSQGGPNTMANLLAVCRACHTQLHKFPDAAYARGLLIRRDSPITPYKH